MVLMVHGDFLLTAARRKLSVDTAAIVNNRIVYNTARTDAHVAADNAVFHLGERRNDHVIADAGSRKDTYAGPDFATFPDYHRPGDI